MLTLQELLDQLIYGELSNLSGGNEFSPCTLENGLNTKDLPRIINHINLGLINLYTKFPVEESQLTIQQFANTTTYVLNSKHAVSNTTSSEKKYILDTTENPFADDIIIIDTIYDAKGCVVPMNDITYCNSIFTPSYDRIQIPDPKDGSITVLTYRAKPVRIDPRTKDLSQVIRIPESLWEALMFYVASRYHASIPTGQELSNVYLSRYYNRIAEVVERNVFCNDTNTTSTVLDSRGWV